MIVIADTTPLNYLVLIDLADLLPQLFGTVLILRQFWMSFSTLRPRNWYGPGLQRLLPGCRHSLCAPRQIRHLTTLIRESVKRLRRRRTEADRLLLDETDARREAARRKLPFIGALGVLRRASRLDLTDLPSDLARLQQTTFHVDPELIRSLLDEDAARKKNQRVEPQ